LRDLEYMTDEEDTFQEIAQWKQVVDLCGGSYGLNNFTIRYVGSVQGPNRPFDRYKEDLTERKNGILSRIPSRRGASISCHS
jgi:DUF2075 family protein